MSDIHDKLTAAFEAYQEENAKFSEKGVKAVSYTHLTLPTIYSV